MGKTTITRQEAGPYVLALAEQVQNILRNEELWTVLKVHLDAAEERGRKRGRKQGVASCLRDSIDL